MSVAYTEHPVPSFSVVEISITFTLTEEFINVWMRKKFPIVCIIKLYNIYIVKFSLKFPLYDDCFQQTSIKFNKYLNTHKLTELRSTLK